METVKNSNVGIYVIDGTKEREELFKKTEQLVVETVNRELRKQSS